MNMLHIVLTALLLAQAAGEEKALNREWLTKGLAKTAIQAFPMDSDGSRISVSRYA